MEFTEYTVEKIEDPFGILSGERYEFFIHFEVEEDDELFHENGLKLRVLYIVHENENKIASYTIMEAETEQILEFELEEDELMQLTAFCEQHYQQEEN